MGCEGWWWFLGGWKDSKRKGFYIVRLGRGDIDLLVFCE